MKRSIVLLSVILAASVATVEAFPLQIELVTTDAISDADGELKGDGSGLSDYVQAIWAGPDGLVDLPDTDGSATGDDVVLTRAADPSSTVARIGYGFPFDEDAGLFADDFDIDAIADQIGDGEEIVIYIRAWNGANVSLASHYIDSTPQSVTVAELSEPVEWVAASYAAPAAKPIPPNGVSNVSSRPDEPQDGQITLTWTNPTSGTAIAGVLIVRNDDSSDFTNPSAGTIYAVGDMIGESTVVGSVAGETFADTDTTIAQGETYYYALYTFDVAYRYSGAVTIASHAFDSPPVIVRAIDDRSATTRSVISYDLTEYKDDDHDDGSDLLWTATGFAAYGTVIYDNDLSNAKGDNVAFVPNNPDFVGTVRVTFVLTDSQGQTASQSANISWSSPSSSGGSEGGGGCFVATAAYGTRVAADVVDLRAVRDEKMRPTALGNAFVGVYYGASPALADRIRRAQTVRAAARGCLRLLVVPMAPGDRGEGK